MGEGLFQDHRAFLGSLHNHTLLEYRSHTFLLVHARALVHRFEFIPDFNFKRLLLSFSHPYSN